MYIPTPINNLAHQSQVIQRLSDSWQAIIGSVSLALITTYIFDNQKAKFHTQEKVAAWAKKQLTDWCFLHKTADGDDTKASRRF